MRKGRCSKCEQKIEPHRLGKQRYCNACHAEHMRLNRKDQYCNLTDEQKKKYKARKLVHINVVRGNIIKKPCIICKDVNSEAHHPDYDKPKQVIWLCRKHHLEIHNPARPKF